MATRPLPCDPDLAALEQEAEQLRRELPSASAAEAKKALAEHDRWDSWADLVHHAEVVTPLALSQVVV